MLDIFFYFFGILRKGIIVNTALFICLCSIWLLPASLMAKKTVGSIEGTVIDRSTYQPMPGATITVMDKQMGAITNTAGEFVIKHVPAGIYQIKASMIGYLPEVKTGIVVSTGRVIMVDYELKPTVVESDDIVVVNSGYFKQNSEEPTSAKSLTPQEIRSSPGAVEDIFRVIQSMPGAGVAGAKESKLIVRGGSPDENLTLLDNIEIYNPLHFGRPGASMGGLSIINASLLKKVDFLTGGFPVKYGDKMSSVFEMQLKEGNRTDLNTDLNLNMAGFGILIDGPVPGDGTILFSVRRGFFDLLGSLVDMSVKPAYWDMVGKATYDLGGVHRLSLLGFYYQDDFEEPADPEEGDDEWDRKYDQKRDDYGSAVGLNWRYLFSKRGYLLTTAALVTNGWKSWVGTKNDPELFGDKITENEIHLKSELTYIFSNVIEVKSGLFGKTLDSDHREWAAEDTTRTGIIVPAYDVNYNPAVTYKTGSFLQTTLRPFGPLSLTAGFRHDYLELTGESEISPRLGLSYSPSNRITLNAAYGHYYQTPAAYQVAVDPANQLLRSSRAIHYIAGIEYLLQHDTKISIEVYHKELDNVLTDNDTSKVITNAGSGYARGIEFYVQKKMSSNLVGSFAYTYSVSKRQDTDSLPEYYFEFDRPHNFTLVSGYKLSNKWQIGVKYQIASGNPYTPVVGSVQKDGEWYVVDGAKNSVRYPAYHKLDIRIDRSFRFRNWTLTAYLDLWNVYNRKNTLSYIYEVNGNGVVTRDVSNDFPIFPILGFSAQF